MAAGPASRLGSFEPGDKTGLRLYPHLAPALFLRTAVNGCSEWSRPDDFFAVSDITTVMSMAA